MLAGKIMLLFMSSAKDALNYEVPLGTIIKLSEQWSIHNNMYQILVRQYLKDDHASE